MALTVFAEKMGWFHKGSNGKGIAPGDVCLSPPMAPKSEPRRLLSADVSVAG